jgi:hypothetical protein
MIALEEYIAKHSDELSDDEAESPARPSPLFPCLSLPAAGKFRPLWTIDAQPAADH